MIVRVATNYEPCILAVTVNTQQPQTLQLVLKDEKQVCTVFTDRHKNVSGKFTFYIRLPIVGKSCLMYVYNQSNGNKRKGEDTTFQLVKVDKLALVTKLNAIDFDPYVRSFVDFGQRFCYNAGHLPCTTYKSDDGVFRIEYLPTIVSSKSGRALPTPARISKQSGRIQVSKEKFKPMTVPERFAILCHEFSHFYKNENINDEVEADINGLIIYLGLGYPRIEAYDVFTDVFTSTPSKLNVMRYKIIDDFIHMFEKQNHLFKEAA